MFRVVMDIYDRGTFIRTADPKPIFVVAAADKSEELNQCVIAMLRQLDPSNITTKWSDIEVAKQNIADLNKVFSSVLESKNNAPPLKHSKMCLAPLSIARTQESKTTFNLTPNSPSVSVLLPFGMSVKASEPFLNTSPSEELLQACPPPNKKDLLKEFNKTNKKRTQDEVTLKLSPRKRIKKDYETSPPPAAHPYQTDVEIAHALIGMRKQQQVNYISLDTNDAVTLHYDDESSKQGMNEDAEKFINNLYAHVLLHQTFAKKLLNSDSIFKIEYSSIENDFFVFLNSGLICPTKSVSINIVDNFAERCGVNVRDLKRTLRREKRM
ncbi:transcriptional repressor NrdR [Acrasis kona]|uniref:Transcriptional repressor NrdR n=1 Tax=Acrasis kona TaxID=1008807 RepID=A0AAW2YYH1_9EUKA